MTLIQCMILAAVLLAVCMAVKGFVKVAVLYFDYRCSVKELLILQHLFQIESCTVDEAEDKVDLKVTNSVLPENMRKDFAICFKVLLQSNIVTVSREKDTNRFIPCYRRKEFEELMEVTLGDAKLIQEEYKKQKTFVRVLFEDYYDYSNKLYNNLKQEYLKIKSFSDEVEVITICPHR